MNYYLTVVTYMNIDNFQQTLQNVEGKKNTPQNNNTALNNYIKFKTKQTKNTYSLVKYKCGKIISKNKGLINKM